MKKRVFASLGILLAAMILGCGTERSPLSPDGSTGSVNIIGDTPTAAATGQISSAYLSVSVGLVNGQPVNVHSITDAWDPGTITWNLFNGSFGPNIESTFEPPAAGRHTVDITALVQRWIEGEDNHGILLCQTSPAPIPFIVESSEKLGSEPFIAVGYAAGSGEVFDTIYPTADVFIDQAIPDANISSTTSLQIGQLPIPGREKQALLKFDMPTITVEPEMASLEGYVWDDLNHDGFFDFDEPGVAGISVKLHFCNESVGISTLTDESGMYRFDSLMAGKYYVRFLAPDGYAFGPANQSSDESLDSDADPETGTTECFVIGEGEAVQNWSAGIFRMDEVDPGCTHSLSYWRSQAGFRCRADKISPLLPIWLGDEGGPKSLLVRTKWVARIVLSMHARRSLWNGILKLRAQLLAAKLNIADGAQDTDIADVISEADGFLANHTFRDWRRMRWQARKDVLTWTRMLKKFNNGKIGPGSCDNLTTNNGSGIAGF